MDDRCDLELVEHQPRRLPREGLSPELGQRLWQQYGKQVDVDFPSPKTSNEWVLKAQGWVGHIPLERGFGVALKPKVPLGRLFEMLEVAYRLKGFRFLEGAVDCASVSAYYDRLAAVLAKRTLDRGRKGYFRQYVGHWEHLPYICGRMDVASFAKAPWRVRMPCDYEDHTGDILDNQILAWTLSRLSRSSACSEDTLRVVRKAYRQLSGIARPFPVTPADCVGRLYTRLNDDYEPLHALCRFFLEHAGPTHEMGDRRVLPFLVDMARLFELFVAEWLKAHLPPSWELRTQERVDLSPDNRLRFVVDLVLINADTGSVKCVLDTKYKYTDHPEASDVQAVIAYAVSQDCNEAVLIYPHEQAAPFDQWVGNVRVRSLFFPLEWDLWTAGTALLERLGVGDTHGGPNLA